MPVLSLNNIYGNENIKQLTVNCQRVRHIQKQKQYNAVHGSDSPKIQAHSEYVTL